MVLLLPLVFSPGSWSGPGGGMGSPIVCVDPTNSGAGDCADPATYTCSCLAYHVESGVWGDSYIVDEPLYQCNDASFFGGFLLNVCTNVQAAVDAAPEAPEASVIVVCPGIHSGNVVLENKQSVAIEGKIGGDRAIIEGTVTFSNATGSCLRTLDVHGNVEAVGIEPVVGWFSFAMKNVSVQTASSPAIYLYNVQRFNLSDVHVEAPQWAIALEAINASNRTEFEPGVEGTAFITNFSATGRVFLDASEVNLTRVVAGPLHLGVGNYSVVNSSFSVDCDDYFWTCHALEASGEANLTVRDSNFTAAGGLPIWIDFSSPEDCADKVFSNVKASQGDFAYLSGAGALLSGTYSEVMGCGIDGGQLQLSLTSPVAHPTLPIGSGGLALWFSDGVTAELSATDSSVIYLSNLSSFRLRSLTASRTGLLWMENLTDSALGNVSWEGGGVARVWINGGDDTRFSNWTLSNFSSSSYAVRIGVRPNSTQLFFSNLTIAGLGTTLGGIELYSLVSGWDWDEEAASEVEINFSGLNVTHLAPTSPDDGSGFGLVSHVPCRVSVEDAFFQELPGTAINFLPQNEYYFDFPTAALELRNVTIVDAGLASCYPLDDGIEPNCSGISSTVNLSARDLVIRGGGKTGIYLGGSGASYSHQANLSDFIGRDLGYGVVLDGMFSLNASGVDLNDTSKGHLYYFRWDEEQIFFSGRVDSLGNQTEVTFAVLQPVPPEDWEGEDFILQPASEIPEPLPDDLQVVGNHTVLFHPGPSLAIAPVLVSELTFGWEDGEIAGHNEEAFSLYAYYYSTGEWVALNKTPDTEANILSAYNLILDPTASPPQVLIALMENLSAGPADFNPPTVTLISPPDGALVGTSSVELRWKATDDSSPLACSVFVDGSLVYTNSSVENDTETTAVISVSEGSHVWNVSCEDPASNVGHSSTWAFEVDTTPPEVNLVSPPDGATFTGTGSLQFVCEASDSHLDTLHLFLYSSDGSLVSENLSSSSPVSLSTVLAPGIYFWNCTANDSVGNVGNSPTWSVIVEEEEERRPREEEPVRRLRVFLENQTVCAGTEVHGWVEYYSWDSENGRRNLSFTGYVEVLGPTTFRIWSDDFYLNLSSPGNYTLIAHQGGLTNSTSLEVLNCSRGLNRPPEVFLDVYTDEGARVLVTYSDEGPGNLNLSCFYNETLILERILEVQPGDFWNFFLGTLPGIYFCRARAFDGQAYSPWAEDVEEIQAEIRGPLLEVRGWAPCEDAEVRIWFTTPLGKPVMVRVRVEMNGEVIASGEGSELVFYAPAEGEYVVIVEEILGWER